MAGAVDFFVSYTSADRPWAEWIAWELEHTGHTVIVQAWDMQPGSNFVLQMDNATRAAERTVALLSPAFLESRYCRAEWAAAFREDPEGERRELVPVRVRECQPEGLLGSVVYVDVVGLGEAEAREALLVGVRAGRAKPTRAPAFPVPVAGEPVRRPERGAAIFNVPVMTRTFVGRERALEQLATGLAGEGVLAVTQVDAIHGLGGVGKTQLAARYARMHRGDYDVVWWLRAEAPATLRADLAGFAVALGLVDAGAEEADAVGAAHGWLERTPRWLLVFDNVTAPAAIAGLVPEGEGGHVLITSRAHADWRSLNARPIALDVWERTESRGFLRARTGEEGTVVLDAVADALGDLPLALEQASAYANAKAITLAGYLQRLRARGGELLAAGQPLGYGHTVATVWSLAFSELAEQPVAAEFAFVCAHLASERIPRELLDALADVVDDPTLTAGVVDDAVELLLAYALLTVGADDTLAMHRLVQDVARATAGDTACAAAAALAVALADRLLPDRPWEHEQWAACTRLLEHALSAARWAEQHNTARELTAAVLARAGQYQQARAEYATACELLQRALTIAEAVYGPEEPEVAITLINLGVVQQRLGEFEAARVTQQRALAIAEAVYGSEHPQVATTLINLGIAQEQLGEFEAALVTQQRALAIFEAVYGHEDAQVARALGNLGNAQQKLGELEAARVTQQRALAIEEAVYGPQHPEVARTLGNLGIVEERLGEHEAARVTLQRALAIKEAVYGPEHPEVAVTLTNLGNVERRLGEVEAGRECALRAVTIFERSLGVDHPYTATARAVLARSEAG